MRIQLLSRLALNGSRISWYETNSNQHQTCLLWATALVNLCVDFILWPSCNHSFKELWMIPAIKRLATKHPFFFIAGKMCSKENPEVLRESHSHQADFQNHPFICWKPRQRCSDWTWGKRSLYTSYPKRKKKKTPIYSLQPSVSPESELIRLSAPCAKINQTNRGTPDRLLQRGKRWSGAWAQQLQRPVSNGVYTKMPECPTCTALQSCTNIRSIPTEHVIELVSIDYFFLGRFRQKASYEVCSKQKRCAWLDWKGVSAGVTFIRDALQSNLTSFISTNSTGASLPGWRFLQIRLQVENAF